MLEPITEAASLPGGVLERNAHRRALRKGEDLVQAGNNLLQTNRFTCAEMRSRMHD